MSGESGRRRTALLVGATGLVGGHCLRTLLAGDTWDGVTTFARRRLSLTNKKLVQRMVDFDRLGQLSGFPRVTDVFCCLGTTIAKAGSQSEFYKVDFTYAYETARLALVSGARQFLLVSSLGADRTSNLFYSRVKGELEEAIKQLAYEQVQIFRPSVLSGDRSERRTAERLGLGLASAVSWAFLGPLRRYRPIEASDVALAMVSVARQDIRGVTVYESDRIAAIARDART